MRKVQVESGDLFRTYKDVRFGGQFFWSEEQGANVQLMCICHELAEKVKLEVRK